MFPSGIIIVFNIAAVLIRRIVFYLSYLQTLLPPCPCWFSTSSWLWWRLAWCCAGAAGHLVGSCGVSASVASYPAATTPAPPASSAPTAASTARSTDCQKSRHTHLSMAPRLAQQPPITVLMKMLARRLFRAEGLSG